MSHLNYAAQSKTELQNKRECGKLASSKIKFFYSAPPGVLSVASRLAFAHRLAPAVTVWSRLLRGCSTVFARSATEAGIYILAQCFWPARSGCATGDSDQPYAAALPVLQIHPYRKVRVEQCYCCQFASLSASAMISLSTQSPCSRMSLTSSSTASSARTFFRTTVFPL